jgi:hypothetical protein
MTRQYAWNMGLAIVGIGIVGLAMGEQPLLVVLNIDIAEDMVHLLSGGGMAVVAFTHRNAHLLRSIVRVVGVTYFIVGFLGFFVPHVFGLLLHGYSVFDNILHLLLGIAGIGVAWGFYSKEGSQVLIPE